MSFIIIIIIIITRRVDDFIIIIYCMHIYLSCHRLTEVRAITSLPFRATTADVQLASHE